MHPKFAGLIDSLHTSFENLIALTPCSAGELPRGMPYQAFTSLAKLGSTFMLGGRGTCGAGMGYIHVQVLNTIRQALRSSLQGKPLE